MLAVFHLVKFYGISDVFVQPSLHETQGVSIIEAMTGGLPVIYTRCGAPEYYMNDKTGIQVEPENVDQLYRALKTFDRHQFDENYISNYALKMFGEKSIAKQYETIFKENIK